MVRQFGRLAFAVLAMLPSITPAVAADDSTEAWDALAKGGHVALIRHGNAPPGYGGDPPGMRIDDCATQRNLDDKGRAQGKALGEAFRTHSVSVDRVQASPMCRCMETARLMAVGPVESLWSLLPDMNPNAKVRFLELKQLVSAWRGPGTLVLVTHGLTVRPMTGFVPDQAETVVLKPTPGNEPGAQIVGRIAAPQ